MSYQAIRMVFERSKSTGTDRLVAVLIAEHADNNGCNSFPSRELLATEGNMSVRTVARSIAELVRLVS